MGISEYRYREHLKPWDWMISLREGSLSPEAYKYIVINWLCSLTDSYLIPWTPTWWYLEGRSLEDEVGTVMMGLVPLKETQEHYLPASTQKSVIPF